MRNIGWIITQVRLSKRFVCSITYTKNCIKTLPVLMNYVCVSMCSGKNLHRTGFVKHYF